MLNLGIEAPIRVGFAELRATGQIQNIFDVEARNHVSFLKDIAPLPGRNFIIGLQARM
jgi:iron complex outermembrane receptor protein